MGVGSVLRVGFVCVCLSGCAMAGVGGDGAPATYQITAPDTRDLHLARWPVNLSVQTPTAARAIDTDRIMVAHAGRISYLAGATWSDRLPRLLRSCVAAALQDSGAFRAVLDAQDRVDSDYALTAEIRSFHIEAGEGNSTAVVTLIARLANENTGTLLATREFSARVPITKEAADNSVAALQRAFGQVATDIVRWTSSQRSRHIAGQ